MNHVSPGLRTTVFMLVLLPLALGLLAPRGQAQTGLVKLSTDTFTNSSSQHATEVEPDTYGFGSTIVATFQVGRIFDGGSSDIGFATTTNGGATWTNGFLPGITVNYQGGSFAAASDPSVAYDAAHNVWMINCLGLGNINDVLISRSTDGGLTWDNPVIVDNRTNFADKNWMTCDNTSTSPFYGHCYVEWDDASAGDQVKMSTSSDGGLTWSSAISPANAFGLSGQPVVQPNGTVVVPFEGNGIQAFTSTNGGTSWTPAVNVASINDHGVHGNMRSLPLPSAEVDGSGKVYVAWQDCRFRSGCSSNDIVYSTSSNGTSWSSVTRVPIDATGSTVDHFTPGIAVDRNTSGSTAHVAITYYFFPVSNCSTASCALNVGFISSQDGGGTWSRAKRLGGPMRVTWLPTTTLGQMTGDYISTSYVNGKAFGVFALAGQKTGSTFNEAMYTNKVGLSAEAGGSYASSAGDKPVTHKSDHGPRPLVDQEHMIPQGPPPQK